MLRTRTTTALRTEHVNSVQTFTYGLRLNPQQLEQEAKEERARSLLRAGKTLYEVDVGTGLGQLRIMELSRERHQEDAAQTRAALAERDKALDQAMDNYGAQDELARRIGRLRRGLDPEGTDEPQSGLNELNVQAMQRYLY